MVQNSYLSITLYIYYYIYHHICPIGFFQVPMIVPINEIALGDYKAQLPQYVFTDFIFLRSSELNSFSIDVSINMFKYYILYTFKYTQYYIMFRLS